MRRVTLVTILPVRICLPHALLCSALLLLLLLLLPLQIMQMLIMFFLGATRPSTHQGKAAAARPRGCGRRWPTPPSAGGKPPSRWGRSGQASQEPMRGHHERSTLDQRERERERECKSEQWREGGPGRRLSKCTGERSHRCSWASRAARLRSTIPSPLLLLLLDRCCPKSHATH